MKFIKSLFVIIIWIASIGLYQYLSSFVIYYISDWKAIWFVLLGLIPIIVIISLSSMINMGVAVLSYKIYNIDRITKYIIISLSLIYSVFDIIISKKFFYLSELQQLISYLFLIIKHGYFNFTLVLLIGNKKYLDEM